MFSRCIQLYFFVVETTIQREQATNNDSNSNFILKKIIKLERKKYQEIGKMCHRINEFSQQNTHANDKINNEPTSLHG